MAVSRYGSPAADVLNTERADITARLKDLTRTERLVTGQRVRVDGTQGTVTLLDS